MMFITRSSESRSRPRRQTWLQLFKRFRRSRDGSAAIEFAILAIPYFLIIFAILETFIAFIAEQVVTSAVDTLGRDIRTGNITYSQNKSTDKTEAQFRQLFCNEISFLLRCDAAEVATPDRLYLDVRSFATFAAIPTTVTTASGSLDISSFAFAPGGAGTINMVRAYYYWPVTVDLVRSYIANIHRPGETSNSDYLIVETTAFQSENY
jgi:Flp pilus assembly protein TadG